MTQIKDLWLRSEKLRSSIYIPDSGGAPFGAAPSLLTTSGVFAALPPGTDRKQFVTDSQGKWTDKNRIAAPDGWAIYQVGGWELRQASEGSVYYQLLLLALHADVTVLDDPAAKGLIPVYFSKEEMLRRLGGRGGNQVKALLRALNLMSAAVLHIEKRGTEATDIWHGNLLGYEGSVSKSDSRYQVTLNGNLAQLFSQGVTRLDLLERAALSDNLSLWLHGYYSQHSQPFDVKVTSLQAWSGRAGQQASKFRTALARALEQLCEVTGWTYDITGGLVVLDRGRPKREAVLAAPAPKAKAAPNEVKTSPAVAEVPKPKPARAAKKASSDLAWSMDSNAEELLALGKKAFVAVSETYGDMLRFNLTSPEERAFEEHLSGLGSRTARQELEALYDFLLAYRAAREPLGENDI